MLSHKSRLSKYLLVLAALICLFILLSGFSFHRQNMHDYKPKKHTVIIHKMKYSPAHLKVNKGDTVVWINKDFFPHDVTEEINQEWTSKPFNKGETWSKVMKKDIKYFCKLHKVMKGSITITK